jgi:class 3 adenylate cyclase
VPSEVISQVGGVGERRHVAVLFSDLCGSLQLSEAMDAEDFAALLEALRSLARRIIGERGGLVARLQGDGLLAVFGYPEVREDDARRAAGAALALHEAVKAMSAVGMPQTLYPLHMHSGLHSGLTFVGAGDLERGRVEVSGDVPNTAARLAALARADQLLASEDCLGVDGDKGPRGTLARLRRARRQ